jgi:hypothetical protein
LNIEARCMDLADPYVNSECVKFMLQADQVLFLIALYIYISVNKHSDLSDCLVSRF